MEGNQQQQALHGVHPVIWHEGCLTVYALKQGEVSAVEDFMESDKVSEAEYASIHATCRMIGETKGAYRDGKRFKKLIEYRNETILEFKKNQVRIGCMWVGRPFCLLLLYGCIKKSDEWDKGDLKKLKNRVDFYLDTWGQTG